MPVITKQIHDNVLSLTSTISGGTFGNLFVETNIFPGPKAHS